MIFSSTKEKGRHYEKFARQYLKKQKLKFVEANFECKTGEIDLIMKDHSELVFIEVRYRKNYDFGGPYVSITKSKRNKIFRTAEMYLIKKKLPLDYPHRYDVVAISGENENFKLEWVKNAFG